MTASIDELLAQRTSVVYYPRLLEEADLEEVRKCQRAQLASGIRPQQHPHKRRTFLSGGGAAAGGLQGCAPAVAARLVQAAARAHELGGWSEQVGDALGDVDMHRLRIRVAEFWEYEPGGGLVDDYHYDTGSIVTIVCLAGKETDFTGGVFRTFEADGTHAEHILECGDALCLLSHKYHNVTPVITGHRHTLVLELWQGYDNDDDCARMASDLESGFVSCDGLATAQQAVCKCRNRLEFTGIQSRDELLECLKFVEDLLVGPMSAEQPLRGLSFASCSLTSDDLDRLGRALQSDAGRKLTAFGISKNPGLGQDAWRKFWARLPGNASWLDFGDNQLVDADVAPLIDALPGRKKLRKLYLDGNKLGDLSLLCKTLPGTNITELDLGDNNVDDTSVRMLSAGLVKSSVSVLVLGTNPISATGVALLVDALSRSNVKVLYLDHTGADDACLAALSKVLEDMKLTELHLDSTKITDAGVQDLIPHIGTSKLTYIDVGGNGVGDETLELLDKILPQESTVGSDEEG